MRKIMKKFFAGIITSAVIFGCAVSALAQDFPPPPPPMPGGGFGGGRQMQMQMPSFSELDKNKDKKLSKDEVPPQMANFFDRLDESKDGFIDETEWNNTMSRFRGGPGGGGGGPRMGESLLKLLDTNTDSSVSSEEFAHIETVFDTLDQDKSGSLSMDELNRFFPAINQRNSGQQNPQGGQQGGGNPQRFQGPPPFADLDKNKDGKLARNEMPEMMAQGFERFDENKDGFVDETEWKKFTQRPRLGDTLAKFMDTNADAQVSRAEFAQIKVLFAHLDKDKNSALATDELNQFNQAANAAASEVANKATGGVDVSQLFTNLDKNKDGKLTPDEVTSERTFKALDLNKDGEVTKEEATESLKKQAERRQQSQPKSPQQQ
jgi:Ca2+-binding EF-hand superfamily protein